MLDDGRCATISYRANVLQSECFSEKAWDSEIEIEKKIDGNERRKGWGYIGKK